MTDLICWNSPHPLFLVSNFKSFLHRIFKCHATWLSVKYNGYLIKYLNTNNVCSYNTIQCDQHCRILKRNSTIDANNLKSFGEKYRLYHFVKVFLTVIKFVKHDHVILVSLQDLFNIMIDFILFYYFYNESFDKLCTFQ